MFNLNKGYKRSRFSLRTPAALLALLSIGCGTSSSLTTQPPITINQPDFVAGIAFPRNPQCGQVAPLALAPGDEILMASSIPSSMT